MDKVTQKVVNTIKRHSLLLPGDTVYVALSGGADSVALLHILCSLRDTLKLAEIRALHMHHGLRGESADNDTAFVESLCCSLNVPLTVAYIDVAKEAQKAREGLEEAGRRLRYAFFKEASKGQAKAKIATAHTASDRVETVVFNMIRGCGLHGLGGIPVKRENIVRPLYNCTSDEIRLFCNKNGYAYCIDETNSDVSFSRNRIRHEIIPSMTCINENAVNTLLRLSDTALEDDLFLQEQAEALREQASVEGDSLSVEVLCKSHPVLINRALMLELQRRNFTSEHRHIDELSALVRGERAYVNLPNRITAKVKNGNLFFTEQREELKISLQPVSITPPTTVSFNGTSYRISVISQSEFQNALKIHKNLFNFCISYDMINGSLKLRSRVIGDCIRPFKRGCSKSLKKLFSELKLPVQNRQTIPIVCDDGGILAVLGIAVDERCAVTNRTERVIWFQHESV